MKVELLILAITAFMVANTYYDGYYTQLLISWKKYYIIAGYMFLGLALYLFIKKNPENASDLAIHASKFMKFMPTDHNVDVFAPFLDMTRGFDSNHSYEINPQTKRMMNSGGGSSKRCVSETKKKYVASQQNWQCGDCGVKLPAWFDVDHKQKLEHGGSNHISNLVALCKNCHGKKTAMENL